MCSPTPRFSYTGPETVICARPAAPSPALVGRVLGSGRVGTTGVGYGWGVQGRAIPVPHPAARGEVRSQRSGPGRPCKGLEWWGSELGRARPWYHPLRTLQVLRGPLRCTRPSPRANAASWPIKARLTSKYCKVSQNGIVSPEYDEKASHSPYIQNASQKSALEILRFPFCSAFSPKELMGRF